MSKSSRKSRRRRTGPSDPQAIARMRAAEREARKAQEARTVAAERKVDRNPAWWGIAPGTLTLEAPALLPHEVDRNPHSGVVRRAQRSTAWEALYKADGLSLEAYEAANRIFRDYGIRAGVRDFDVGPTAVVDAQGSAELVTQAMIDAGRRIETALRYCGPSSAKLIHGVVEPVATGNVRVWRALVQAVAGTTEVHAQAERVRVAFEDLVYAYQQVDRLEHERRESRREVVHFAVAGAAD